MQGGAGLTSTWGRHSMVDVVCVVRAQYQTQKHRWYEALSDSRAPLNVLFAVFDVSARLENIVKMLPSIKDLFDFPMVFGIS